MSYDNIPRELRELKSWVNFGKKGCLQKEYKKPYTPGTYSGAKANKPETWRTFNEALTEVEAGRFTGVGFELTGSGIVAIDFDGCITGGIMNEIVARWIDRFDSYTEVSPSGKGIHILCRGKLPGSGVHSDAGEMYDTGRYMTMTGNVYGAVKPLRDAQADIDALYALLSKKKDTPTQTPVERAPVALDDSELVNKAIHSSAKFAALWNGDISGYPSHSEADQALCNLLAFWTNGDEWRIDSLFRCSGLMREKWDKPTAGSTYGANTVKEAIRTMTSGYNPEKLISANKDGGFVGFVGFVGKGGNKNVSDYLPFTEFISEKEFDRPEFPTQHLSKTLCNLAVSTAESLQVVVDMPSVVLLAIIALCVQHKFQVYVKADWVVPVNIYTVIVAPPSERKSPVINFLAKPIYEYEKEENERRQPQVEEYKTQQDMLLRRIEILKKEIVSIKHRKGVTTSTLMEDLKNTQEELRDLRKGEIDYTALIADDITMEALASKMISNNEKMAIVSSEGGIFNILSGLYTGGVSSFDLLLKAYSGDHIQIDRKGRPPETMLNPALTVLLMTQPEVLRQVMENNEFKGKGLNARFLYSIPKSLVGKRKIITEPIPFDWIVEYNTLLDTLLNIPDTEETRTIRLSQEAFESFVDMHNEIEPRLITDLEPMADWAGKFEGVTVRIAGLLHICDHKDKAADIPMPGETMERAKKIAYYFLAHAKIAYSMSGLMDTQAVKDAKYILKRIAENGTNEITKRDLHYLCQDKKGFEKSECLNDGLNVLRERGYIKICKSSLTDKTDKTDKKKGGRPSEVICLNPEYLRWREEHGGKIY